jgi:hypothetical protein
MNATRLEQMEMNVKKVYQRCKARNYREPKFELQATGPDADELAISFAGKGCEFTG